jgi:hypothetical protein
MWMKAAQVGMSMISAIGKHKQAKADAKAARAMQAYRNKMTNIANGINQNAITQNTTLAIQQSAKRAVHMRRDALQTAGATEASAAASGTKGNSVNATLLDVHRNAGLLEKQRADDLEGFFLQQTQQRLSSALSAAQNQDLTHIPKPKLSSYLMDAAISQSDNIAGLGKGIGKWASSLRTAQPTTLANAGLSQVGGSTSAGSFGFPSKLRTQSLLI